MTSYPLPDEDLYYDIERDLIDNEPPGLFPEDQFSYWGQVRHVFAEHLQLNIANALAQWYINLDPRTVNVADMPEWEEMLGIPAIPADYVSGVPEAYRRATILTRYEKGPFTRTRRDRVIEQYINATFAESLSFGTDGIAMDSAGRPLYADTIALKSSYRVYEDVRNFAYEVQILNTITPDVAVMLRELKRITPAPTSANITINNSVTDVLDYAKAMRNTQPVAHYIAAADGNDTSGYGNNATVNGGVATVATPGLIHSLAAGGGCFDFDGTNDYLSAPHSVPNSPTHHVSMAAWIRPDTVSGLRRILIQGGVYALSLAAGSVYVEVVTSDAYNNNATSPVLISTGTTYFVAATFDGDKIRTYVNGSLVQTAEARNLPLLQGGAALEIGGSSGQWFDGRIDEVGVWNYALSQAQITELYNQGIGVA